MNHSIVTQLEDLPVEIFTEIFDYFTAAEIYVGFAQLNDRLNSILKSLHNLIFVTEYDLDPILSFFHSFKAIHVKICHSGLYSLFKPYIIKGGHRLFQRYPSLDYHWYPHPLNEIENIRPDICSQLRSLILPTSSSQLVQMIFNGEFPLLEICHLGKCDPIILPLSTTTQLPSLRQLTIREQNGNTLEKILLMCPSLIYLDFSCNDVIPKFVFTTRCFSSMKYLRLGRLMDFMFHNGQFDILLSFFPSLHQFHLIVNQSHKSFEIIQFAEVAEILLHRLPSLKILDLRIYMMDLMYLLHSTQGLKLIARMHPLFKYILQCNSLVMITSYGFVPNYAYTRRFVRPSFE
ncbi:unnamed protein product [Rotaria sordida]|uniref:F-box domain-containing protein n=1 Tax=Rotaria sordida TaxID=392033 RepID=A0A819QKL3_9BILA|nr:unnamed protein product [Rotaria sordida]CAF1435641.1 unnamed protein product [Rotaria sordida]CAF3842570.1 unnamed protein product [Rotaria sordida]CAF4030486.1 unnamed protein product [Rotaria sordida]